MKFIPNVSAGSTLEEATGAAGNETSSAHPRPGPTTRVKNFIGTIGARTKSQFSAIFSKTEEDELAVNGTRMGVLHAIPLSDIKKSLKSAGPSALNVTKTYTPDAVGYGIHYDAKENVLWLTDYVRINPKVMRELQRTTNMSVIAEKLKLPRHHVFGGVLRSGWSAAFKLGPITGLPQQNSWKDLLPGPAKKLVNFVQTGDFEDAPVNNSIAPMKAVLVGPEVTDTTTMKYLNTPYFVMTKCGKPVGFGCRLEFHDIPTTVFSTVQGVPVTSLMESDAARMVRLPDGAVGLDYLGLAKHRLLVTFDSAAQSKAEKAGPFQDVEDSTHEFSIPSTKTILKPSKAVALNAMIFRLLGKDIVNRPLLPFLPQGSNTTQDSKLDPDRDSQKRFNDDNFAKPNSGGSETQRNLRSLKAKANPYVQKARATGRQLRTAAGRKQLKRKAIGKGKAVAGSLAQSGIEKLRSMAGIGPIGVTLDDPFAKLDQQWLADQSAAGCMAGIGTLIPMRRIDIFFVDTQYYVYVAYVTATFEVYGNVGANYRGALCIKDRIIKRLNHSPC